MEQMTIHKIDYNPATKVTLNKVSLNNPPPRDMFKEIHGEFSKEEKRQAKSIYNMTN